MSNSERTNSNSLIEVFTDTSVLFNYALDVDKQRADELLLERQCRVISSKAVRQEFERVMERRQAIHTQLLPYIKNEKVGEFKPKNSESLSNNDWGYVREFCRALSNVEPAEAARRVQERNRQLKQAYRQIFEIKDSLVVIEQMPPRDASLLGNLSGVVHNDDDVRILCDAVEWCRNGGTGIFLTSDKDDMLPGEDRVDTGAEKSDTLSDSFADFLSGDLRSTPEKINEAIQRRYSCSCCLEIHSTNSFLNKY